MTGQLSTRKGQLAINLQRRWVRLVHHRAAIALLSIATPILGPRHPPLPPQVAVECGLAQLPIHLIVRPAQPPPELVPPTHAGGLAGDVCLKVLGAPPAGVKSREEPDKGGEIPLLGGRSTFRVSGRDAVEEGPGGATEGFDVRGAVGSRGGVRGGAGVAAAGL